MVRLVCVFLQSIIKSKLISIQEIQCDLNQFCLDFNGTKEANAIFKILQVEQYKISNQKQENE